jgi:hypothetical protein
MGDVQLSTPRLRVRREGYDDLEVQSTNADLVLWDRTRWKHKWPTVSEAPFLWLTFIGWAAARRTGAIPPDVKYETWETEVLEIEPQDDGEEAEAGRPTPLAAGLD